ncbi:MAG: HEAT repeat protein, partial [Myxococcota bacterium]
GVIPLARYAQEPPSPAGFPQRVLSFRRSVTQMYALKALSKMGPLLKPTLPVLLSLRGIPHGNSRCYLPRAIAAACDDPNILLDCLKQFAKDHYQPVRADGLHYLGPCGHPDAIPILLNALRSDTDKNVRISTIHALSSYGEAGEAGLLEALSDPEPRARLCVLQYLVLIDKPAIRARLTEASKSDRSKKVRDAARQALCG